MNVFLTSFQRRKVMRADMRPSEHLTGWPPGLLSPAPKLSAICLKELPTFLHFSTSWLGLWLGVTRGGGGPSLWLSSGCVLLADLLELLLVLGLLLL